MTQKSSAWERCFFAIRNLNATWYSLVVHPLHETRTVRLHGHTTLPARTAFRKGRPSKTYGTCLVLALLPEATRLGGSPLSQEPSFSRSPSSNLGLGRRRLVG